MFHLLGLKIEGLFQAFILPLCLTMVLFLGPLSMKGFSGLWRLYTGMNIPYLILHMSSQQNFVLTTNISIFSEPMYWVWNLTDLVFLRNHIVAPVTEEFVFRACMLPLLLQCFQPMTAVFIAPLFFGVGMYFVYISFA